jgi:hypothetical protein
VSLPIASSTEEGSHAHGIRCRNCGRIALEFIGTNFVDTNGEVTDLPPIGHVHMSKLPWTQSERDHTTIDRANPTCQYCNNPVQTRNHLFFVSKNLVHIATYNASVNKAHKELMARRRSGVQLGKDPVPGDLGSANYDSAHGRVIITPEARERALEHSDRQKLDKLYETMNDR